MYRILDENKRAVAEGKTRDVVRVMHATKPGRMLAVHVVLSGESHQIDEFTTEADFARTKLFRTPWGRHVVTRALASTSEPLRAAYARWAAARALVKYVCPCSACYLDYLGARPMRLAKWRDSGLYWPGPRDVLVERRVPGRSSPVVERLMAVKREDATFFGPQHTAEMRGKPAFIIVKPARQP